MDDLTILEVINLASVRLASHNVTAQIPSNIPVHNQIINRGEKRQNNGHRRSAIP